MDFVSGFWIFVRVFEIFVRVFGIFGFLGVVGGFWWLWEVGAIGIREGSRGKGWGWRFCWWLREVKILVKKIEGKKI